MHVMVILDLCQLKAIMLLQLATFILMVYVHWFYLSSLAST